MTRGFRMGVFAFGAGMGIACGIWCHLDNHDERALIQIPAVAMNLAFLASDWKGI